MKDSIGWLGDSGRRGRSGWLRRISLRRGNILVGSIGLIRLRNTLAEIELHHLPVVRLNFRSSGLIGRPGCPNDYLVLTGWQNALDRHPAKVDAANQHLGVRAVGSDREQTIGVLKFDDRVSVGIRSKQLSNGS